MKHFIEKYKEVIVGGESISDDPNIIYYETFNDNPNEEDFSEYFDIDQKETDNSLDEMYGGLIGSKITLDYNDSVQDETILRRNRNTNESLIRTHNNSPIPDTMIYQVDFRDDKTIGMWVNSISENLHEQMVQDDHSRTYLDSIIDIESTKDVYLKVTWFITLPNEEGNRKITTKG